MWLCPFTAREVIKTIVRSLYEHRGEASKGGGIGGTLTKPLLSPPPPPLKVGTSELTFGGSIPRIEGGGARVLLFYIFFGGGFPKIVSETQRGNQVHWKPSSFGNEEKRIERAHWSFSCEMLTITWS